ncbi:MAG: hypothetical protein FWC11_02545 [Firmicutes bacterium]|nr:hypothetical protein [Bacillota bacterium]MCL2255718.1 hypothetical protein [Bacillota bacterium]
MNIFSFAGTNNQGADIAFMVIFLVLAVVAFAALIYFVTKFIYVKKDAGTQKIETPAASETKKIDENPKRKSANQSVEEDKIEEKVDTEEGGENETETNEVVTEETVTVDVPNEETPAEAVVESTPEEIDPVAEEIASESVVEESQAEETLEPVEQASPVEEGTEPVTEETVQEAVEPEVTTSVEQTPELAVDEPLAEESPVTEPEPTPPPAVEPTPEPTPEPTSELVEEESVAPVTEESIEPAPTVDPIVTSVAEEELTETTEPVVKRSPKKEKQKTTGLNLGILFGATLGLGLVLRLIFTFVVAGHRGDMSELYTFMNLMSDGNMWQAFSVYGIYPVQAWMFMIFGGIGNATGANMDSIGFPLLYKLPFIIADLVTAFILFKAAKRYINAQTGLIFAAFIMLFPLFIFASSIWGSVFSIFMMLLVLTFYLIAKRNYIGAIFANSFALLTTRDALYVLPVVLIFLVVACVRYGTVVRHSKPKNISGIIGNIKDKRESKKELRKATLNVILIPTMFIASLVLMYLVSLPVLVGNNANPFVLFFNIFFYPLGAIDNFGTNALNIFNLFLRNDSIFTAPMVVFSILFAVVVVALVMLIYISRKNRANLSFLAAFILLTLSVFFMGFGAMNLVAPLGLFLLSFILIKDKRILKVFGLTSFAVLLNGFAVMASAGYLNNNSSNYFTTGAGYTGNPILNEGGFLAISIISSIIVILTFVYAVLILLDLSMSDRRRLLKTPASGKFFESIKNFFKK